MQQHLTELSTASVPRITYRERGGSGMPVLLLHGVGSSSATWFELVPHLDPTAHIIAPDYRGHGASEAPTPPYRLSDFVDDLIRLLDELAIDQVDIVGFSIGALFGEALALVHPDRVHALVLLSSIGDRTDAERARAGERLRAIRTTPPADGVAASAERWFTSEFRESHPHLVAAETAIVAATPHAPYAASYEVLVTNDLVRDVGRIAAPALVVTGEHDIGSTPRMSEALHARLPRSELVVLPGVRHYIHIEAAEPLGRLITDFLSAERLHRPAHQKENPRNAHS